VALGAVLTTATQLRSESLPLGIGEVVLAVWMVYACIHSIWSGGQVFTRDGFAVYAGLFWVSCVGLLSLGSLLSLASRFTADTGALHDTVALTFCAGVTILVPLGLRSGARSLAAALVTTIAVVSLVLLLAAFSIRRLGPIELWYGFVRFTGWAKNPNQMALLVVGSPFLAWQLAVDAPSKTRKAAWLGAGAVAVAAGIATLSDAVTLAWGTCLGLCLMVGWRRAVRARRALAWGTLMWGVLLPLTLVCAVIPILGLLVTEVQDVAASIYSFNGQGSVRFKIWQHALESVMQSPVFGWGPGAHAGNSGAHQGYEAHNTFIDWAASAGLLGLLAYLLLLGGIAMKTLSSRKLPLFFGVVGLAFFSTFHFVLRHPMFWIYLLVMHEYSRWHAVRAKLSDEVAIPCAA
jgi:O-antigen ligase